MSDSNKKKIVTISQHAHDEFMRTEQSLNQLTDRMINRYGAETTVGAIKLSAFEGTTVDEIAALYVIESQYACMLNDWLKKYGKTPKAENPCNSNSWWNTFTSKLKASSCKTMEIKSNETLNKYIFNEEYNVWHMEDENPKDVASKYAPPASIEHLVSIKDSDTPDNTE